MAKNIEWASVTTEVKFLRALLQTGDKDSLRASMQFRVTKNKIKRNGGIFE
jgi:hypothetical protein